MSKVVALSALALSLAACTSEPPRAGRAPASAAPSPATDVAPSAGASASAANDTVWLDPAKLERGPVLHERLGEAQVARITRLQAAFAEVEPTPVEKWIDDFRRDRDPDGEIAIWEAMAGAYGTFTGARTLTLDQKKEAFGLLLLRSGASAEEALQRGAPAHLTREDAAALLALYREPPKPIGVTPR